MSDRPLVRAEGLGKRFKIYPTPWHRGLEWLSGGRLKRHSEVWALRGVTLTLRRGECLGIIGPNGSGKTTLLKILSRVLVPTEGQFEVQAGTVYSLLELGTGFHPDLTGRENVRQSARLLGLPEAYTADDVVEKIEDFADVGEYFDRPIRFYSSGMLVRLGFSLFAFLKPELLVVDEALSVGDIFFQQKCVARIDAMREAGVSFLFVSHDMAAVRRLCREAIVLEHGRIAFQGPTDEAINRYHALLFPRDPGRPAPHLQDRGADPRAGMTALDVLAGNILRPDGRRHGSRGLEIRAARVTDERGTDTFAVRVKGLLHLDVLLVARDAIFSPSAGLSLLDRLGNLVFSAGTGQLGHRLPALQPGDSLVVRLSVRLSLQPGQYTLMLGTSELGHPHDWHEGLGPIDVFHDSSGLVPFHGIAELPMECRHGVVEAGQPAAPPA